MLALLARNAEANLHLFACEGSAADDKAASSTAIAVREALRGNGNGSWTDPEAAHDTSSFDSHEGGEKTGQVVMVRELDWLTFSRRGGASDSSSICSSIGEKNQVRLASDEVVHQGKGRKCQEKRKYIVPVIKAVCPVSVITCSPCDTHKAMKTNNR